MVEGRATAVLDGSFDCVVGAVRIGIRWSRTLILNKASVVLAIAKKCVLLFLQKSGVQKCFISCYLELKLAKPNYLRVPRTD